MPLAHSSPSVPLSSLKLHRRLSGTAHAMPRARVGWEGGHGSGKGLRASLVLCCFCPGWELRPAPWSPAPLSRFFPCFLTGPERGSAWDPAAASLLLTSGSPAWRPRIVSQSLPAVVIFTLSIYLTNTKYLPGTGVLQELRLEQK